MGRFSRDTGAAALDYIKQPLPLFGAWSMYSSAPYGLNIYDSEFNLVSATNSSNYAPFGNSEMVNTMGTPPMTTNPAISSSGLGSGGWIKATTGVSVDGNQTLKVAPDGSFQARYDVQAGVVPWNSFGVVVGPEGYRQNYSLSSQGVVLRQHSRGHKFIYDAYTLAATDLVPFTAGLSAPATNNIGQIAYNRNLGTLTWVEPQGTNGFAYRLHVWKHPNRKLSGRVGELKTLIQEARSGQNGGSYYYSDFSWKNGTTNLTRGTSEAVNRCRLVPSNVEGVYGISRFEESSLIEMGVISGVGASTTATFTYRTGTVGTTTAYGNGQGNFYGMRHQMSWDNKWCIVYAPYYYYGCGIVCFVFNVDDPTQSYHYSNANTSDGIQVLPFGRSGFIFGGNYGNSDSGQGVSAALFDPGSFWNNSSLTPLVAGGAFLLDWSSNYFLESYYTSTLYPGLVPIDRWSIAGVAQ